MKKLFLPLISLATALMLSSCGGSPVNKFLDKVEPILEAADKMDDIDDLSSKEKDKYVKIVTDLVNIIDEYEDYELTESDKEKTLDFMVNVAKKKAIDEDERLSSSELKSVKKRIKKNLKKTYNVA